jgi:hypothetical protein
MAVDIFIPLTPLSHVTPGAHHTDPRDETYRLAKVSAMSYRPPHGFPVRKPAPTV